MYTRAFWDSVYVRHFNDAPWLLEDWTRVGVSFARRYIGENFKGRILDYGCGNAAVSKIFMEQGCRVDLAEISSKMVVWLNKEYAKYDCNVMEVSTPGEINKRDKYDYILAFGLFHHIDPEYWPEFIAAFHRLLSPGGILLINGWDALDDVLSLNNMKAPMTGEESWYITDLIEYVNTNKFDILENSTQNVVIHPFKNSRTVRCFALKKK